MPRGSSLGRVSRRTKPRNAPSEAWPMARLNRAAIPPRITTSAFLLGFLLLAGAAFAPSAEAAPTARFTASPVQGAACVAPCAVHLDATATTSTDHARPFHELDYTWECGEPTAGLWPTRLGGDKNRPRGPISGCIYDTPGTKTIRLTVREPDGQTSTTTSTVTVAAPLAQYGASNIWCFRAGATGDFRGCPLDGNGDGVCELDTGGHCATQASF